MFPRPKIVIFSFPKKVRIRKCTVEFRAIIKKTPEYGISGTFLEKQLNSRMIATLEKNLRT